MSAAAALAGLVVVIQDVAEKAGTPSAEFMTACLREALGSSTGELTLRLVDERESAALNERYRGKQGPTNVLAFEAGDWPAPDGEPAPLGDIVICVPVVVAEARDQGKSLEAHWAHMLVHGALHLIGYDHLSAAEAVAMESRERELLARLGFDDPYRDEA